MNRSFSLIFFEKLYGFASKNYDLALRREIERLDKENVCLGEALGRIKGGR